jgi:hypothetical protein
MRNIILSGLILLLAMAGCITVDMGGGSSSKAPKIIKFEVGPSSISSGGAAILAWEVENASSVSIDPGIPAAPSTGADKVAPATTTTYILTASNNYGSTRSTVLLTVGATGGIPQIPAPVTPVINAFSAAPSSITAGNTAVLTWSTTNATGARINGADVAVNGSQAVNPSSTLNYILEATNGSNSTSASTMVVVTDYAPPVSQPLPAILSFTANPSSVTVGGATILSWNVANATSVSIANIGPVEPVGSRTIYTSGTGSMTFSLTATNSAGSSYASTTISVGSITTPPLSGSRPTAALYVSPSSITSGNTATLSWMTSGAGTIAIDNGVKSLVGITGASGSVSVAPTSTTTYTLIATNGYGSTYSSQVLTVTAAPIPYIPPYSWPAISKFKASETMVLRGSTVTLSWNVSNADSVIIDNGIGPVSATGTRNVTVWSTTTYTLMATTGANTLAQPVTITVP